MDTLLQFAQWENEQTDPQGEDLRGIDRKSYLGASFRTNMGA